MIARYVPSHMVFLTTHGEKMAVMTVVILIHQMVKMKLMVWRLNLLPHLQAKPKYPVSIPVCECLISTGSEYIWDLNGEVERSATVDKFFIHLVSK